MALGVAQLHLAVWSIESHSSSSHALRHSGTKVFRHQATQPPFPRLSHFAPRKQLVLLLYLSCFFHLPWITS